jgi:EAL domain-containing protein (putative c-di-GMP-specific phosphodiesterase class I)
MQAQIAERHALERDLRNAVRNGELVLFLQSQVSASGDVVGAEALLRWQHPARGMLTPDAFIPLAEESGLIVEIGEWVLREACGLLACMTTAGVELRMAVNVSPRQFHQPDFVAQVARALDQSGAPAGRLTLEVTENLLMAHATEVVSRMQALARLGVRFAIDDFGIGYSSLAYLKRLPLEELKIDRSFVHGLPEDASNLALVETMLSMAQNLNFDVVAEGVEEQRQLERLAALGCRRFQGYCFARPEPCSVWLARHGSSATLSEPLTEA